MRLNEIRVEGRVSSFKSWRIGIAVAYIRILQIVLILGSALGAQDSLPVEAVVRGRCLAKETGKPIPGVLVKFQGATANSHLVALHGRHEWKNPKPATTDADGRFAVRFIPPPTHQHFLSLEHSGRAPRTGRWGPFKSGQVEELGDVMLERGFPVSGRVVDRRGRPVRRVSVSIRGLPLPIRGNMTANDSRSGFTDAKGRFTVRVPIPAGTWPLRVSGTGLRSVAQTPEQIQVGEQHDMTDLHFVVERLEAIRGVVFDERRLPVHKAYVVSMDGAGNSHPAAWTRKDGSFVFYRFSDELPDKVRLSVSRGNLEPMILPEPVAWGTHGLEINAKSAKTLKLTVVERRSSDPVIQYAILCHKTERPDFNLRQGGRHPGGKVTIRDVLRGKNLLTVIPKHRWLVPASRRFDATDEPLAPMRIELTAMRPFRLRVHTSDGNPAKNVLVQLLDLEGHPYKAKLRPNRPHEGRWYSDPGHSTLLFEARTDEKGYAEMYGLTRGPEWMLRIVDNEKARRDLFHQRGLRLPEREKVLEILLRQQKE